MTKAERTTQRMRREMIVHQYHLAVHIARLADRTERSVAEQFIPEWVPLSTARRYVRRERDAERAQARLLKAMGR